MGAQVIAAILRDVRVVNIIWPIIAIAILASTLWIEYRCYRYMHGRHSGGGFLGK